MNITALSSKINGFPRKKRCWSNQDLADFYRAATILKQAGLNTDVDSGFTDEGDPWFVFLRPETGDVVAHFAQIDGAFIAVSSLNGDVYRGADIREIIDKILERYPLVMPQPNNGGRVMLHPTAAITAFLAASFILSIDKVKATSVSQFISSITNHNASSVSASEGLVADNGERQDALKAISLDVMLSNYNVAMLGAALIAHELNVDLDKRKQEISAVAGKSILESEEPKTSVDRKDSESDPNTDFYYVPQSSTLEQSIVSLVSDANEKQESFETAAPKEIQTRTEVLVVDDISNGNLKIQGVVVDKENYVGLRDLEVNFPHLGPDLAVANHEPTLFSTFLDHVAASQNDEALTPILDLEFILNGSYGALQSTLPEINPVFDFEAVSDSVILEAVGDSFLVTLGSIMLTDSSSRGADFFIPMVDKSVSFIAPASDQDIAQGTDAPINPIDSTSDQVGNLSFLPNDPILGHSFHNPEHILNMTSAIDVVFYKGGHAEIAGFELGKDVLWFFLSPQTLSQAENSINEQGDLRLDFGDLGALTFLGVVAETSDAVLI